MDYDRLIKPYRENGRTVVGQKLWLIKKGILPPIVDQAMLAIYEELERGKTYPNGHELDVAILMKAKEIEWKTAEQSIKNLEGFHEEMRDKWQGDFLREIDRLQKNEGWFHKRGRAIKIFFGGKG